MAEPRARRASGRRIGVASMTSLSGEGEGYEASASAPPSTTM